MPHVAVRLWNVAEENPDTKEFARGRAEMRQFVSQMPVPYCGHHAVYESQAWFGESAPHLKSFALVELSATTCTSAPIALGSEDPKRFYPGDGDAVPGAHRRAHEPCAVALRHPVREQQAG